MHVRVLQQFLPVMNYQKKEKEVSGDWITHCKEQEIMHNEHEDTTC